MMKFEELTEENIQQLAQIYWDREKTYDARMAKLSSIIGKSG